MLRRQNIGNRTADISRSARHKNTHLRIHIFNNDIVFRQNQTLFDTTPIFIDNNYGCTRQGLLGSKTVMSEVRGVSNARVFRCLRGGFVGGGLRVTVRRCGDEQWSAEAVHRAVESFRLRGRPYWPSSTRTGSAWRSAVTSC